MQVDPVEFGKLLQSVETLTQVCASLEKEMKAVREQLAGGRGVMFGLLIAAGASGAAVTEAIKHFIK